MTKRYIAVLASAALLLTLSIALAACGGGSSTTPTPSKAGTATAKPSSAATTAATHTATPAASSATSGTTVAAATNANLGKTILVDAGGKTLYTYDKDTAGTSACTGACATAWPPLPVASGSTPKAGSGVTGALATITRADGTKQVTYKGAPLYTYQQDAKAGDASGDGVNSFHAATP
jgi:predicted lipoprotein with Yx(FWY)xxD motif